MNTTLDAQLDEQLVDDWMAWLVIRHLLPMAGQRSLARRIVQAVTGGRFSLEQLVDEVTQEGPTWNEAWIFRERPVEDRTAQYAQRVVSAIAWQTDGETWADPEASPSPPTLVTPHFVSLLLLLSVADFSWPEQALEQFGSFKSLCQPSLLALMSAFSIARGHKDDAGALALWEQVDEAIAQISKPLRFAITKHLADLCADADRWRNADTGYKQAEVLLLAWSPPTGFWSDLVGAWLPIVSQSRAAARRVLEGPKEAAQLLDPTIAKSIQEAPLDVANAALDAHVFSSHPTVKGYAVRDDRVRIMRSPLLLDSLTAEHAMRHWLDGKHDDASRHWWSLLRKQLALGSTCDAQATMSLFARCSLDRLRSSARNEARPEEFEVAVRLILASGRPKAAEAIEWTGDLVDAYLTQSVVDDVLQRIGVFPGTTTERQLVAIQLFKGWVQNLSPTAASIGESIGRALARMAHDGAVTFDGLRDVARPAFDALRELARRRPEWIGTVAGNVAEAVLKKLAPTETWWAHQAALEVAQDYLRAMDDDVARAVIVATLHLLEGISPEREMYPVVRPAFGLLISDPVRVRARADRDLSQRVLSTIMRFGIGQESEMRRVLFYIHDFDRELLRDEQLRTQLAPALEAMRRGALEIANSSVCESIHALLLAPAISGRTGLLGALDGLQRVLASATAKRASPGLAFAYDPILELCSVADDVGRELGDDAIWRERLDGLAKAIGVVWERACKDPILLAAFELPPATKPSPVLVHNWAFATARFGQVFGYTESLQASLNAASGVPELRNHVQLAQATQAIAGGYAVKAEDAIAHARSENREGFYTALGRWLVLAETRDDDAKARELWMVLVSQVLRFGPRALDAAVLLGAVRRNLREHARNGGLAEYAARLRADSTLNLVLQPIVQLLRDEHSL